MKKRTSKKRVSRKRTSKNTSRRHSRRNGEYHFGSGFGRVANARRINAVARRHGADFVNPRMPEGYRYWFSGPNLGHPFDKAMADAVWRDLDAAGLLDQDGHLKRPRTSRRNSERMYHVIVINERTGKKVRMTRTPVTHREGTTILSKMTKYKWRRNQLEEAGSVNANKARRKRTSKR